MKIFVIGDIHGTYKALLQCFDRSGFDYQKDRLIVLGDVCDRYAQVNFCFEELLKIKHCDYIIGNHDLWALDWALKGIKDNVWLSEGGTATIESYTGAAMPQLHIDFLKNAVYYLEINDKIFVHGGFDPEKPITAQDKNNFVWDRTLIAHAGRINSINPNYQLSEYKEIYLCHTPTTNLGSDQPMKLCNVWDLDTGAGWGHKLTIMNIDTKEYWQSDPTLVLYSK